MAHVVLSWFCIPASALRRTAPFARRRRADGGAHAAARGAGAARYARASGRAGAAGREAVALRASIIAAGGARRRAGRYIARLAPRRRGLAGLQAAGAAIGRNGIAGIGQYISRVLAGWAGAANRHRRAARGQL